jgi:DNA-directed RNA polymerase specialized sigma24 family protein
MGSIIATGQRLRSIVTRRSLLPPPESRDAPGWEESWSYLFRLYTPAMIRYVRSILGRVLGRLPDESEAADVVQDYFAECIAKGWLSRDAENLRCFRAYLQTQLRRFTYRHLEHKHAKKRHAPGPTSHGALERVVGEAPDPADAELDRGWVQVAVDQALDALREGNAEYHEIVADLLRTHGDGSPDLGERMARTPQQLVHLRHRARKRFALLFHERLRESVRDDEAFEELCQRLEGYLP